LAKKKGSLPGRQISYSKVGKEEIMKKQKACERINVTNAERKVKNIFELQKYFRRRSKCAF
jgi:hypothetical protein